MNFTIFEIVVVVVVFVVSHRMTCWPALPRSCHSAKKNRGNTKSKYGGRGVEKLLQIYSILKCKSSPGSFPVLLVYNLSTSRTLIVICCVIYNQ